MLHTEVRHPSAAPRPRARWFAALCFSLVPVVLTAAGTAAGQAMGAGESISALLISGGAAVSAVIGLLVLRRVSPGLPHSGFRAPNGTGRAWLFLPPVSTIALLLVTGGFGPSGASAAAYLVLAAAVALNEEIWFRGVLFSLLRPAGIVVAMAVSSVLFGVLHLANLAAGADTAGTLMQVGFAVVFGTAAVGLVAVTRSLWPSTIWHFMWNFFTFVGNSEATPIAWTGVGISCLVMLVYTVHLWRQATTLRIAPAGGVKTGRA